jgi:Icc-related predicted phosphoesterase
MYSTLWPHVDVLLTHVPPHGLDFHNLDIKHGRHCGDSTLQDYIHTRGEPKVHVFGHIHEGYGVQRTKR